MDDIKITEIIQTLYKVHGKLCTLYLNNKESKEVKEPLRTCINNINNVIKELKS